MEGVYESHGAHPGIIGSHEGAGFLAKLGSEAEKKGILKVGDRVGTLNVSLNVGRSIAFAFSNEPSHSICFFSRCVLIFDDMGLDVWPL